MFGRGKQEGLSEESKDWEIGQRAKDGSIFIGQRGIINPDGSLGKVYNIFSREKDLGFHGLFTYVAAIGKTAKFNKRKGYGAVADETDQEVRQALAEGTYNGRWTIPSQAVLSSLHAYVMDGKVKDNFNGSDQRGSLSEVEVAAMRGRNRYGGIADEGNYWSSTVYKDFMDAQDFMYARNFDRGRNDGYETHEPVQRNALSVRLVRYVEAEPKQLSPESLNLSHEDREALQKFYIKAFHEGKPEYIQDQIAADTDEHDPKRRDRKRREIINELIQNGNDAAAVINLATAKLPPAEKKLMLDGYLSEVVRFNRTPFIEGVDNIAFIASLLKAGADPNAFSGEIMLHLAHDRIQDRPTATVAKMLYESGADFDLALKNVENYSDECKQAMKSLRDQCTGGMPAATVRTATETRRKKNAHTGKPRSPV